MARAASGACSLFPACICLPHVIIHGSWPWSPPVLLKLVHLGGGKAVHLEMRFRTPLVTYKDLSSAVQLRVAFGSDSLPLSLHRWPASNALFFVFRFFLHFPDGRRTGLNICPK